MLRKISAISLLVVICSAYAQKYTAATSQREIMRFTKSNATFLSIAKELNVTVDKRYKCIYCIAAMIMNFVSLIDFSSFRAARYTRQLYGGGVFLSEPVH